MTRQIPAARIYFPKEDITTLDGQINLILQSGQLTLGKYTKEFEERFSSYSGTKYGIAVNSGTSALEIILRCLDMNGSSVIIPTNTFAATAFAAIHAGAEVIFAEIGDDLCLDSDDLNEKIKKDTKAVIIVHIGGIISTQIN